MSLTRTTEERRRDDMIRSINNLVKNCQGVNENLIPTELKQVLLEIKKVYPNGVSIKHGAEFGYMFVGESPKLNPNTREGAVDECE